MRGLESRYLLSAMTLTFLCLALAGSTPGAEPAPEEPLRRLTHSQYNNTVRDLLGDRSRIADQFPPEDFVNGFKNQLRAQSMSPLLAEAYSKAAEKLTHRAFWPADSHKLVPCRPSSPRDRTCAAKFVAQFGRRAFRRPLYDRELQRYLLLLLEEAEQTGDFLRGAQMVVETMLQSPKFLFHLKASSGSDEFAYVIANRLSYFLWDTMPDEELFAGAAAGDLDTAAGVERQARRMLSDPHAREAMGEFFSQWLRFDQVLNAVRDRRLFPEFTPELAATMTEETRRLLAEIVWNDRDFMEIYTADYGFFDAQLASLYGLPAPEQAFQRVTLPAGSPRAGFLGQATFLAGTSHPAETSPTSRGIFVREKLLCQHVPPPPPGSNANLPIPSDDKPKTTRERLTMHAVNPACAGCHQLIDPIGFGLESFDALGRYREKQRITFFPSRAERNKKVSTVDLDLDVRGRIAGVKDSEFSSPRELGSILVENPDCQRCVAKQVFRYAFGRLDTPKDTATIERSFEAFRESGFRFRELLVSLTTSDQFRAPVR